VSLSDEYTAARIYEWTGQIPQEFASSSVVQQFGREGERVLDHPLNIDLIRGRRCIDIGCGSGRWTKVMLTLGAESVLAVDAAESAIESASRVTPYCLRADLMRIPEEHPELVEGFDFATFWGVAMCTHNPLAAFTAAASTVRSGGSLYLMVYAPDGMNGREVTRVQRCTYQRLRALEDQLAYVEHVRNREWDWAYPWRANVENILRKMLRVRKEDRIGVLDMLSPFYNWVIPLDVIKNWMMEAGFSEVTLLNDRRRRKGSYHVLGTKPVR
jgi:SAM-dependent methyltransferase